jgi:hypothetical protein
LGRGFKFPSRRFPFVPDFSHLCRFLRLVYIIPHQQETLAFGDGLNDVEMFTAVGAGIAMGDACEALKAVATHVTGTLEEDGIARALVDLGVLAARDVGL